MRHVLFLAILFAGQLEGLINGHANHVVIGTLGVQAILTVGDKMVIFGIVMISPRTPVDGLDMEGHVLIFALL
jgi:hypothetical protein